MSKYRIIKNTYLTKESDYTIEEFFVDEEHCPEGEWLNMFSYQGRSITSLDEAKEKLAEYKQSLEEPQQEVVYEED